MVLYGYQKRRSQPARRKPPLLKIPKGGFKINPSTFEKYLAASKLQGEALQVMNRIEAKADAEQREAALRLELSEAYAELLQLENEVARVRCRLDCAQVAFTSVGYKVRALEALGGVA